MIAKILICLFFGMPLIVCGSEADSHCQALAQAKLPNVTITAAQLISNGTFAPPTGDPISGLPDKPANGIAFQRPICAYPKFPNYMGGDRKAASSYRCVDHPRGEVLKPAKRYLN